MVTFPSSPINGQIYSTDKYDYIWDATANKWLQKQSNPSVKHKLLSDTSTIALDLSQESSFEIHTTGQSLDTEVSFTNPPTESGKFTVKVKNDYDLPKQVMLHTGNSFDFLNGEFGLSLGAVTGVWFKPDGTRMFVADAQVDRIYQLDLTTPWDVQSRVYSDVVINMSGLGVTGFERFSFDVDGKRIFAVDTTSTLHQIDLTTAWDLSTAVDNDITVSLETILGVTFTADNPIQVAFNYNDENPGTKMFFIATVTDRILYEVEMVTPWDIVNAQYAGASANLTALSTNIVAEDITFNQDGTKFFTHDLYSTFDHIKQFSLTSAYSVASGVTYDSLVYHQDTYTGESGPSQIYFKPDYTKYWIAGLSGDSIYEFDITDPNDITTSSYTGSYVKFYNFTLGDALVDAQFSPDGKTLYVLTATIGAIYQFDLRIPFDISSMVFANKSSDLVNTYHATPESFYISPDGSHAFTTDNNPDTIIRYSMSEPGNISTLTYIDTVLMTSLPSGVVNMTSMWFKPDGTRLFMITVSTIYWWDLPTPWDITSATALTGSHGFNSYTSATTLDDVRDIAFSNRGDTLYFLEQNYDTIFSVELSTPWDPSSGTLAIETVKHNSETGISYGFALSRDSDKILVLDGSYRYVFEYESTNSLDSSFDQIETISNSNILSNNGKTGIWFKPDGTRGYWMTGGVVYQYDMTSPWSTASHTNRTTVDFSTKGLSGGRGLALSNDGNKAYLADSSAVVYQYNLTVPWDFSSAPDTPSKSFSTGQGALIDVRVSPKGDHLYVNDTTAELILHYTMTGGDVDTMVLESDSFSTTNRAYAITGDGRYFLTMEYSTSYEDLEVYSLTTPWDLFTAGTPFTILVDNTPPAYYVFSLYVSPNNSHLAIGNLQNTVGAYFLNPLPKSITWPDNLTWEGNTTPEMPLLDQSKVFDIYTTDGGTTYQGVERISAAYNLSSLIE